MTQRRRDVLAAVVALVGGVAIGIVDSRPSWDDTGITAGVLLIVAGTAAATSGRRPWIWALATGIWIPLFEFPWSNATGPFAAMIFAGVGATIGWLLGRR